MECELPDNQAHALTSRRIQTLTMNWSANYEGQYEDEVWLTALDIEQ